MEKYLNNCKFQMILGSSLKMWIFLTKLKNPKLINLMSCTFKSEQDQNKPLGAWKSGSSSASRRISYPLYLSGTSFRLGRFSDFSFLFGLTGAAFFSSSGSSTYSKNHVYPFKISLFEFYNIFYKYCTSCFKSTNITFIFYFDSLIS